ncbi:MAG: hemerythrin domain-containing protein [Verrucomicrobiota bacterium]
MKITQSLLAEHVVFHNIFDYLERAMPSLKTLGEIRALSSFLESMLRVHSLMEDELLIEPLEACLCQLAHHENFHEEHEAIEENLATIQTARSVTEAKRLLLKAVTLSRRHFDKEERIVFPLAEELLSSQTLLLLGKRWEEERKFLVA